MTETARMQNRKREIKAYKPAKDSEKLSHNKEQRAIEQRYEKS